MGPFAIVGSMGSNCRPRQGGLPVHSPPPCLDGWVTDKNFYPRGLQILWLTVVEESWSAVQEGARRCRAGRAHAKTEVFHKN